MTGKQPSRGDGRGPSRKRRQICMEQKMKIILKHEMGQSLSSISRELGFATSTVNSILKDRERIKEHVKRSASLKSTVITKQRSGAIYEMEKLLTIWIVDQIKKHVPLSMAAIQSKARSLYEDVKIKFGCSDAKFVASNGWFQRFKHRAGFHDSKANGEAASADSKAAECFPFILKKVIEEGGYSTQQIFNVDETELSWRNLLKDQGIRFRVPTVNDSVRLLLGANAAGDCKLKPLVLNKSSALEGFDISNLPVHYHAHPKSWLTNEAFEDWFLNCFVPEVGDYCSGEGIPFKILLVLDNAIGHPPNLDNLNPNVKVKFLPSNTSSLMQPLDLGIITHFKAYYFQITFMQALEAVQSQPRMIFQNFFSCFKFYHAVINITKAWFEIKQSHLSAVWKKLCPQFVYGFEGFEKDVAYEEEIDKISKIAKQLDLQLDGGDVEELIQFNGAELSNDDLMELGAVKFTEPLTCDPEELEKSQETAEEEQLAEFEACNETMQVSQSFVAHEMTQAFYEIASAMTRFQKMDSNTSRFSKVKKEVEKALTCYTQIYESEFKTSIQTSVDNFIGESVPCSSSQPRMSEHVPNHIASTSMPSRSSIN